jgi:mono/diheme cytochrome c family protein
VEPLGRTTRAAMISSRRTVALAVLLLSLTACSDRPNADPANAEQVARGKAVYAAQCVSCHGPNLEGQPNWRQRLPNGRFPAPPHDATGHTWHHSDALLFDLVKLGVQSHAPPGYQSDMPAFADVLSDADIWAVLAYIKSTWPDEQRKFQAQASNADARSRRQ